jgi:hypothetical protein
MPIRRPRSPKPVLRHLAFLETMTLAPEGTPVHQASTAALLTLRLLDHWLTLGSEMANPEAAPHRAAREAVAALDRDAETRAALLSILNAVSALQEPDAQPVLPRVYALGGLIERRGRLSEAGDIYDTVARYVDSTVHLDLAYDAHMRRGFCLRVNGELEWADQAYGNAGSLATRDKDRVRVLLARLGQAKVQWARGDLPGAEEAMVALGKEAEQLKSTRVAALILHDRSGVAHHRGETDRAIRLAYDALVRMEDEFERERVLADLANYLSFAGASATAVDALRVLELTGRTQETRWSARINLMDAGRRAGNEMLFSQYRRLLTGESMPETIRLNYLHDAGMGCVQFGEFDDARAALSEGLAAAERSGLNRSVFKFEQALRSLENAEAERERLIASRPTPSEAPDDIAAAIRELLAEATAVASA